MSEQVTNALPPPPPPTCPECGAEVKDAQALRCWKCREPFTATARGEDRNNPFRLPSPAGDSPAWAVFAILAMMVVVGLAIKTPGLLVVPFILSFPALIRTAILKDGAEEKGAKLGVGAVLLAFITSFGVVIFVSVAAAGACCVTCVGVFMGGVALHNKQGLWWPVWEMVLAFLAGGTVGLTVFIMLFRFLSRRRE